MKSAKEWLAELTERYPELQGCAQSIEDAYSAMLAAVRGGGQILVCGNGGSCADCAHIVGELLKGFVLARSLPAESRQRLRRLAGEQGAAIAGKLQGAIPAVNLCSNVALITAVANDTDPDMIFAQQLMAYSNKNNVLLGISPIGRAGNIVNAMYVAAMLGIKTIGLTAQPGNEVAAISDIAIVVPRSEVFLAQELHLPVYHTLCLMLEAELFGEKAL